MDNGHFITVLLGVIFGLWVLLLGVGGYCLKRISDKLDDLVVHREGCIMAFADRDGNSRDHREFYRRTDDHENRLTRLEALQERKGEGFFCREPRGGTPPPAADRSEKSWG